MNLAALKDYVERLEALPERALEQSATMYDLLTIVRVFIQSLEEKQNGME